MKLKYILFTSYLFALSVLNGFGQIDKSSNTAMMPSITIDQAQAKYESLKIDYSNTLTLEEYQRRFNELTSLREETIKMVRYSKSQEMNADIIYKYEKLDFDVKKQLTLISNKLENSRIEKGKAVSGKLNTLTLKDVYDVEQKKFINQNELTEFKENIFYSGVRYDISTHAVGRLVKGCEEFGINPQQPGFGYRISLDEDYSLYIIKLSLTEEVKAILWNKNIPTESRVVDVF